MTEYSSENSGAGTRFRRALVLVLVAPLLLGLCACYPTAENNNLAESVLGILQARQLSDGGAGFSATVQIGTKIWDRCTVGQVWSAERQACLGLAFIAKYCNETDNDCNGGTDTGILTAPFLATGGIAGLSQAYTLCDNSQSGGLTSWRLPTIAELRTLIVCSSGPTQENIADGSACNSGATRPTLDTVLFPATPMTTGFFTSTSSALATAYIVNFIDGKIVSTVTKTQNRFVRCVSDAP